MLVVALMFGGQFAFISGSAFVLIEVLRVSPDVYGLCFGLVAFGIMTGSFLAARLTARAGIDRLIAAATGLGAAAGCAHGGAGVERHVDRAGGDRADVRLRDRGRASCSRRPSPAPSARSLAPPGWRPRSSGSSS